MKSKHIQTMALIILVVIASGCDALYRLLDKQGAEEKELVGEIVPLEKNPTIEEVQALLKLYGYAPGNVDGVLGGRTRDAIEKFQLDNGLEPSRFVDQQTWQRLQLFNNNGFIINGELNIVLIQEALKKAGFSPGKADGKMGEKTKASVKAFQQAHQLTADGKIGYQTLSKLLIYLDSSQENNGLENPSP